MADITIDYTLPSETTGQEAYDTNYHYICVATDTWKRAPLSTW